jgi:predicted Zn-dependent protease
MDVSASLGALTRSRDNNYRVGIPQLLVGDYQQNNSNFNTFSMPRNIGREDDAKGIATAIWESMGLIYKRSAESYEAKQAAIALRKFDEEDTGLPDMEQTQPVVKILEPVETNRDKAFWNDYACKASEIVKKYPEIISSGVNILNRNAMIYTYNTEGTQMAVPHSFHTVNLFLKTRTEDGQDLNYTLSIEHSDFKDMPALQQFIDTCEVAINKLLALRKAPLVKEAYSGPVLFENQAVVEVFMLYFFIYGDQSLIARRKSVNGRLNNNTEMMKDKKMISRSLSIKSLSGSQTYKGKKLEGYIPVDEEGVVPEKEIFLVENGVLRNMLNGRTPSKKFQHSNGHTRLSFNGHSTMTIPGNILLTSNNTFTKSDLIKKLLNAAKEEDLDYAYIVRNRQGNSYEVYRINVSDGHEELVRGVVFPDLNMKSFKRILGASDTEYFHHTYNFGTLSSFVVPDALLFEELEVTPDNNINFEKPYIVPQP